MQSDKKKKIQLGREELSLSAEDGIIKADSMETEKQTPIYQN